MAPKSTTQTTDDTTPPADGDVDMATLLKELEAGEATKTPGAAPAKKKPAKAKDEEDEEEDDDEDDTDGDDDDEDEEEDDDEDDTDGDDDDDEEEDDDEDDTDGDDDDEEEEDDDEDDEDDEGEDADLTPALKKRLAAIQKRETKHRKEVARARAELDQAVKTEKAKLDAIVKEYEPKIALAQKVDALKGRGLRGFIEAAELFGLGSDDDEAIARAFYVRSKAGQKDPRARAEADRMMRERESSGELAKLREEHEALKKKLEGKDDESKRAAQRESYVDHLVKVAGKLEDAPLVQKMLAKSPKKTREKLFSVAAEIGERTGQPPKAAKVIRVLEKRRRRELAELDVDVDAIAGKKKGEAGKEKPAAAGKDAKSKKEKRREERAAERKEKTRQDEWAELERDLREGRVKLDE